VDRVEVVAASLAQHGELPFTASEAQGLLQEALGQGGFRILGLNAPHEEAAIRVTLEMPVLRLEPPTVGVVLSLRRRMDGISSRYQVAARGEVPSGELAKPGLRHALEQALARGVRKAYLQLQAVDKDDEDLVEDLSARDPDVRDRAILVLAERRNPAVAQALLDKLSDEDPDQVRRAVGALVELKEVRAVPLLIDLAKGRDPVFLREIVYALGAIGGDEAQAYLYTVAQGHDQQAIREAAQQALDELTRSEQKPDRGLSSRGGEAAPR
jgi:hypothetical protein